MNISKLGLALMISTLLAACVSDGSDQLPAETAEGLKKVEDSAVYAAYFDPDATLADYEVIYISDVRVAFRKNWLKEQNQQRPALTQRITQEDADRIKAAVAEEFKLVFTEQLEKGGYKVLEDKGTASTDDDVLVLAPAIIDLDISAPEQNLPGRTTTFAASAGAMTLYMELYDGWSSAMIGRVADSQSAHDYGTMRISNSVTNKAEADRMLRKWADLLVKALDAAHGK